MTNIESQTIVSQTGWIFKFTLAKESSEFPFLTSEIRYSQFYFSVSEIVTEKTYDVLSLIFAYDTLTTSQDITAVMTNTFYALMAEVESKIGGFSINEHFNVKAFNNKVKEYFEYFSKSQKIDTLMVLWGSGKTNKLE